MAEDTDSTIYPLGASFLPNEKDGVAFRVWAPSADAVSVIGTFNDWNPGAHSLSSSDEGIWSCIVPNARVGDEYKFSLSRGENIFTRVDPRALKVSNSIGNGILWHKTSGKPAKSFKASSRNGLVIYELHIGTFNASKETGPGTFASAIGKLSYLVDLGINAVELMPIAEFAGDFSWGYNPAHPFAVKSTYGGPQGLYDFVEACHVLGIAVILDVVYNHFGPGDLSMWQFDGWSEHGYGEGLESPLF